MKVLRRKPRARAPKHPKTLGERLWLLRESLGSTQQSLAEQVGVVQATVSAWEKGTSEPSGASWLHLERILRVTRRTLQTGRGFKLPDSHGSVAADLSSSESFILPAFSKTATVMQVERKGLANEAMDLKQAQRALRKAAEEGRPIWLVIG